jgi:tetratricopeptide (TPR) repeat protein
MNLKPLCLALLLSPLLACAHPPVAPKAEDKPKATALDNQLLYQFLLGEIAGQRGDFRLATDAYTDLAARTRDARVAKRATEIAMHSRAGAQAFKNAQLWVELDPAAPRARQTLISLLLANNQIQEAKPHLEAWIKLGKPEEAFMQMQGMLSRHKDKLSIANLVNDLAAGYPGLAEGRFAVAHFALQAGQNDQAISAAQEALAVRPGWEPPAQAKAQALHQKEGPDAALAFMDAFLKDYPQAREMRLTYAKQLAKAGRLPESRKVFEQLAQESPHSPGVHYALGLVALQGNDLDNARSSLLKALELRHPDPAAIRLYLGQIDEARGKPDEALAWYEDVARGPAYLDARLRGGALLGKLGRVKEARAWLGASEARNDSDRIQLIQAETLLLRDAKDLEGAYQVLSKAIEKMPGAVDLIYDRAMVAEKQGKLDLLEKDLLEIIRIRPDYAHAYNALGYTLADRTNRIQEAIKYLDQAIKLLPDDPFVLDSMGWALFKARRYEEGVTYLRRAFSARPDPEIAAHLGEALWARGERDEARRVWSASLRDHPDNEVLRETMSRLAR